MMKSKKIKKMGIKGFADLITKMLMPLVYTLLLLLSYGCNGLLDIDPPKEKVSSETVFSTDFTAVSAMTGIYHGLIDPTSFSGGAFWSTTFLTGISSDELIYNNGFLNDPDLLAFFENNPTTENEYASSLWTSLYKSIYSSNALIEGLSNSIGVTDNLKKQLRGEALFVRAFCHFYAVNLFGDVPLIKSTDYQVNSRVARTSTATVYEQIVEDLTEARDLLGEGYIKSLNLQATDRVRVNKYAAAALLSRIYLYLEDWVNAEAQASYIIMNSDLYELNPDLENVFLASTSSNTNKEVIWQLMPVASGTANVNTWEGNIFVINDPSSYRVTLSDNLLNAFEAGDGRLTKWVGTYDAGGGTFLNFPYKYKIKNGSSLIEYSMVLRLSEQYLIRAEARAIQGNISGAQDDFNAIRNRALLTNTTANDQASLLSALEQERRVEFFAEWGHRWFDLKRWNTAVSVLGTTKSLEPTDTLYPIPQSEINLNSNLRPQNPGY